MPPSEVKKLFATLIKKLDLDIDVTFRPLTKEISNDMDVTIFLVGRSERDLHDKNSFIVFYNTELLSKMSKLEIKKSVFHELLHILSWPLIDEHQEALKHITNKKLAEELVSRARVSWENVVYTLEKKLFNKLL